ncbi:single-stranded DNA-binding protein [Couchioplanes azureus]|uniref:single-stranded DNA-binding protein n=1 Tax=Couchioplanes caeruleus TaxID=56438 RepID=UPI0016717556|nr:single-stranded DNA-binding protein [Couchioplanes caeruleus]GGQ83696.1 hypothetical protein GCM10010166_62340 [Couchioplanes caeruleus subsp. azureus]
MQFVAIIEGTLTTSPVTDKTRDGREFVQLSIVHRVTYRDTSGKQVNAQPMSFDILCWGDLASRARNLHRGDTIIADLTRLLPYDNNGILGMKAYARNVSVSMRYAEAHAGPQVRQRRGDLVTTAHGETVTADAYPEIVTDRELIQHR